MTFASEARLAAVPWRALQGLAPALDAPLAAVLASEPAERVVDRFLRAHRELPAEARAAAKEAIYGVAVWRRRLGWHAGAEVPEASQPLCPTGGKGRERGPSRLLLAALVRDLGGVAGAEELLELRPGTLPPPRPPPDDPAIRFSFPDWLWAAMERELGPEAPRLADALDLPGPVCLRPNGLRTTPAALAARLAAEGVATAPGRLAPSALLVTSPRPNVYGLAAWREGLLEVQDEASQLAGALVEARPGEELLDLCAGAGGKTLLLAAAVAPGGAVDACDLDPERLRRLSERARRAGAGELVRVAGAAPPAGATYDAALVDAPCSELGALRRGPDQRFRLDPAAFAPLPGLQLGLLARAAVRVRPGGRLVYATCTFRREENEEVAEAFERAHPAFAREAWRRTWPHRDGADAFFVARWRRG
ncbi:RsmB/NOP family class I SAM-dependent RNA methyltransferase [Anaeromyxobacter diazotrophicus]|uniref:NOL1/NOP2/Sun family protein n=1 Tax=Anaeromyxobacter diazotrophicus TaxID=2590199 RepID=A0A7I9VPZ0_9BACT|nr:RsmB/NOP family class I SAM-dependent RNA methyltransferase [Anaeromyxobacter diazotrophicus]GEJ58190.1 NOL1/NOP2/Sun family protein [Anaeromyxobacter diazotrophicus]